jgi:hypothetical protein
MLPTPPPYVSPTVPETLEALDRENAQMPWHPAGTCREQEGIACYKINVNVWVYLWVRVYMYMYMYMHMCICINSQRVSIMRVLKYHIA